ncbi:hypothetical protein [Amphritea sp.]
MRTASSMSSNGIATSTGPKIYSCTTLQYLPGGDRGAVVAPR